LLASAGAAFLLLTAPQLVFGGTVGKVVAMQTVDPSGPQRKLTRQIAAITT
jgi:hypothetical protein